MQAEPNWMEMYEWAHNMARKMTAGIARKAVSNKNREAVCRKGQKYWENELASAAVCHLYEIWPRIRHLPDEEWQRYVSTVLFRAMLATLKDDSSKGTHGTIKVKDPNVLTCDTKEHLTDEQRLENSVASDELARIEDQIDFETIKSVCPTLLTKAENRVMANMLPNPDASAAEIAATLGDTTAGAVRILKHNAMKKLKSFLNNDINASSSTTLC